MTEREKLTRLVDDAGGQACDVVRVVKALEAAGYSRKPRPEHRKGTSTPWT
jgi:hypothetical protein